MREIHERKRHIDNWTFGNSKAATNLIDMLKTPEYHQYERLVCRRLMEQIKALHELMAIKDLAVRRTALIYFHKVFKQLRPIESSIINNHTLCVEATEFKKLWHLSGGKPDKKEEVK